MRKLTWLLLAGMALTFLVCWQDRADEAGIEPLRWNVFLSDWQLLGPFPQDEADPTGLETRFVENEAMLQGGQVSFYKNKLYTWTPYDGRVINFRQGLKATGTAGDNVVAYAWTQFTSPVAQKALLAVGYDDTFIAWVNGQEVCRGTANWAAALDQGLGEVELKAGVNTLLLKVGQGIRAWDAAARFRPPGLEEPMLTFRCEPTGDITRLPTVGITLLDAKGQTLAEHRSSGLRKGYPGVGGYYALYAPQPDPAPKSVRFTFQEAGLRKFDETYPWTRVQKGNLVLPLAADRPLELLVVDQATRKPVAGAETWTNQNQADLKTSQHGRVSLADFSPMTDQCWVVAKGYAPRRVQLKWPRGQLQRVELVPGGRTLSGTIVSTSGRPLAGAKVSFGVSGGYSPAAITDELGRFEIYGLPETTSSIYPVVECRGFISKDQFSFQLSGAATTVTWELAPGATIVGKVTHQETGEPISGITITAGEDRFGSNNKNPTAKTDADGRYELAGVQPGTSLVHAFSDDYAPAMQPVTVSLGEAVQADFRLREGKLVTGVITDVDGKPLAGVWLVTDTWNGARMFQREARTDNLGRFTMAHMPETAAHVDILKSGYISHRGFQMRGGDTVRLQLRPVVVHTVRVRDAEKGQLVPELQIAKGYLWPGNRDWHWSSSQWETERHYNKLTGVMKIEIDEPINGEIAYRFRAAGYTAEVVSIPRDAETGQTFQIKLKPAEVFEGRVVDAATGAALPGIMVALVSREDRLRSDHYVNFITPWEHLKREQFTGQRATTDAQGRFRLSPPTTASPTDIVLVSQSRGFHLVTGVDGVLRSAQLARHPLELPLPESGAIEGRVIVAGKPLAGAGVHLQWMGHGGPRGEQESFGVGGQVTADAEGRFKYTGLGPGRYRISRVFSFDMGDSSSMSMYLDGQSVVLLPGQTVVHTIDQPAGLSVSGFTRDASGNPIGNCVITATVAGDMRERVAATTSDSAGKFLFEHLAPGSYSLTAEHYARHPQGYYDQDLRGSLSVDVSGPVEGLEIGMTSVSLGRNPRPLPPITGTLPPDFTVTPRGSASPFTLSQQFGKVAVVCFWGSWTNDFAALSEVFRKYQHHADVAMMTVYLQDGEQFQDFAKKQPVAFPVVTTEPGAGRPLSAEFGAWSRAVCFVIGRDGRFAAEQLSSSQLADAIEQALLRPLDRSLASTDPARLSITLSADGAGRGIPGASVTLRAVGPSGQSAGEAVFALQAAPRQLVWRYPPLPSGGRLLVTLSGRGIAEQQRTLNNPAAVEKLEYNIPSPRTIAGQVLIRNEQTAVAGMQVKVQSSLGEKNSITTDAEGRFSLPCFPGTYYVTAVGNEQYAPAATGTQAVQVQENADPKPIVLKAVPAVTIRGRVVDPAGKPVAGATVMSPQETRITTDAEGNFTMSGVASVGSAQLWAATGDVYGAVRINNPSTDDFYTITLGQGLNEDDGTHSSPVVGGPAPPLEAWTLEGEKVRWSPTAGTSRLLVFCALWHPESKVYLEKALQWAQQHNTDLELISLDWSLPQARRELEKLNFPGRALFAGPSTLRLGDSWNLNVDRAAFLVQPDGKLAASPLE